MKEAVEHAVEAVAIKAGNAAQAGGALASLFAFATSNEGVAVIGIIAALGGLAVSWYFANQRNTREAAKHAMEMRFLQEEHTATMQGHERVTKGVE